MKYVVHRRFKDIAFCGDVNLPAGTECEKCGDAIIVDDKPICLATSENAHKFFARNDDGQGMKRGKLTRAIERILSKRDQRHQERWDKVWDDEVCQKYRRTDYDDYWLWNHDFYNAEIEDLEYIAKLVGAKVVK